MLTKLASSSEIPLRALGFKICMAMPSSVLNILFETGSRYMALAALELIEIRLPLFL